MTARAGSPGTVEFVVDGLGGEVEILVDTWGVPHIYAGSSDDVYLAQGFNAARDRLYQIDLWRRRGLGRLAEAFGADHVAQDRASRLFLYRGDMRAEWLAYGDRTKAVVTSFVRGVNAYVAWVLEDETRLPPEFHVHGHRPSPWQPEDAIRFRTHGLFANVEAELARAMTLRDFGAGAEEVRFAREPADPLVLPEGSDPTLLSEEVLRDYRLAFSPADLAGAPPADAWQEAISGSNNWVVAGSRTSTGRPILANDPHRAVTLPSLRYMAHLDTPDFSVIGAGEPGLPGISIGHNGKVAFGLTIWPVDHEDLYVYELDPHDPGRYRYDGGWERLVVRTETVQVAGGEDVVVELPFTRHGPVVHQDAGRGFAVAVRAVWLEPGMAPYLASLGYQSAATADEFVASLARWGAPGVNQVYATPEGDIGWQTGALVPRRVGWDGSVPVPGDGRYEWQGFAQLEELPGVRNPEPGWFATANQMNLPDGYDNEELTITYGWYPPGRYERLAAWLDENDAVSVEDSVLMQFDSVNLYARRICRLLAPVPPASVRDADVLARLVAWDGDETVDSFEALVFEVWLRRHFREWLVEHHLTGDGLSAEQVTAAKRVLLRDETTMSDLRGDVLMLERVDVQSPVGLTALSEAVDRSLHAALEEIAGLLGADRDTWSWGALHHTQVTHAAFAGVEGLPAGWRDIGPAPRAGSGDTVGMVGYDADFRQSVGSTFRVVIDVGEWDRSRAVNSPGQSGDPRSPHYADLFDTWAAGDTFPLVYSREAVEANVASRIRLVPGPGGKHVGPPSP